MELETSQSDAPPPPPAPPRAQPFLHRPGIIETLLLLAAILPFLNSLTGPFLLDDVPLIERNAMVHRLDLLPKLWTTEYWASTGAESSLYRPLTMTTYALMWALSGKATWPFHATNILLHALVCLLVWRVGLRAARTLPAFAAALLFAGLPIHTEAVANIVGRAEILVALGFLISLGAWNRLFDLSPQTSVQTAALPFVQFAAGALLMLFSKETGLFLAAYFLVESIGNRRFRDRESRAQCAIAFAILASCVAVYVGARANAVSGHYLSDATYSLHERIALSASAALKNLELLIFPTGQRALWPLPDLYAIVWPVVVAGIASILLCLLAPIRAAWRWTPFSSALVIFSLSLLPLCHLVPNIIHVWERGLYVPSIGLVLAIHAMLTMPGRQSTLSNKWLTWCFLGMAVCMPFQTAKLSGLYADKLRFWEYQYRYNERDPGTALNYSEALQSRNRTADAIAVRSRALKDHPDNGGLVLSLATLYQQAGDLQNLDAHLLKYSMAPLDFKTRTQSAQGLAILANMAKTRNLPAAADAFTSASRAK
ncbi:MAG: hypothetical protein K1X53_16055 [Candidatus Sumerlaeaceae bacterium]|nr:hypothetical protein [Candidatus Sumerlaeaceae bacterium]